MTFHLFNFPTFTGFTDLNHVTTEIEPSEHYVFSSSLSVLEIHNVHLADRGNYSLTAGNEAGIRSSEIQMDVYGEYIPYLLLRLTLCRLYVCTYVYIHMCTCVLYAWMSYS